MSTLLFAMIDVSYYTIEPDVRQFQLNQARLVLEREGWPDITSLTTGFHPDDAFPRGIVYLGQPGVNQRASIRAAIDARYEDNAMIDMGNADARDGWCQLRLVDIALNFPVDPSPPFPEDVAIYELVAVMYDEHALTTTPSPLAPNGAVTRAPSMYLKPLGCFITVPGGFWTMSRRYHQAGSPNVVGANCVLANYELGFCQNESAICAIPTGAQALLVRSWSSSAILTQPDVSLAFTVNVW